MLKDLLGQYDSCQLECDGLTRVLHTVLNREGIEHTCRVGSLTHIQHHEHILLHFRIALPDGQFVDYRARLWLGDTPDIPHGIFKPMDYPHIEYMGEETQLESLSPHLFAILTGL